MSKDYHKIDHSHCWTEDNPPCGIKCQHRCCLCNEPVPSTDSNRGWEEEFENLAAINYNLYLAGTVQRADTGEEWTNEQAEEELKNFIHHQLQKAREEERRKIKEMVQEIGGRMYFDHERLREYIKDQAELNQDTNNK